MADVMTLGTLTSISTTVKRAVEYQQGDVLANESLQKPSEEEKAVESSAQSSQDGQKFAQAQEEETTRHKQLEQFTKSSDRVRLGFDSDSQRVFLEVMNTKTGEVLAEIPPEPEGGAVQGIHISYDSKDQGRYVDVQA